MIILPVLVASYKWMLVTTIYPKDSGLSKFQVIFGSIAITLLNRLSVQYPLSYCFCHRLYNCHLWTIPGTTCPLLMINASAHTYQHPHNEFCLPLYSIYPEIRLMVSLYNPN